MLGVYFDGSKRDTSSKSKISHSLTDLKKMPNGVKKYVSFFGIFSKLN
ncbi:hypothetical protein PSOL_05270 [Candidatus Phytoplasma solani]